MTNTMSKILIACYLFGGCRDLRDAEAPLPTYDSEIAELLRLRCVRCHEEGDAAAALRLDSYLGALACSPEQPGAALLEVLSRRDHADRLDDRERERLRVWIEGDVPLRDHRVHAPGILNPRSSDWHGRLAARDGFGPLQQPAHPDACGRCHAGAPSAPPEAQIPALGATACTDCHTAPEGVMACGTCHGDGESRAHPPRDPCLFAAKAPDAHRVHLESSRLSDVLKLDCETCHPPAGVALSGTHADGRLDIAFDAARAGEHASYDPETKTCAVRCHGPAAPRFDDDTGTLGCNGCHDSPPRDHYAGECTQCHREANANGTALTSTALHLNGRVDLGSATGGCGDCHGEGDDPMPRSPSHDLHRDTTLTASIRCNECHPVPVDVASPGHLDRGESTPVDLVWGERASARGQAPSFASGTCQQIACHGAGLPGAAAPLWVWNAPPNNACEGCHGVPPAENHPRDDTCASLACHGAEVSLGQSGAPMISGGGRAQHINGTIDTAPRTAPR